MSATAAAAVGHEGYQAAAAAAAAVRGAREEGARIRNVFFGIVKYTRFVNSANYYYSTSWTSYQLSLP